MALMISSAISRGTSRKDDIVDADCLDLFLPEASFEHGGRELEQIIECATVRTRLRDGDLHGNHEGLGDEVGHAGMARKLKEHPNSKRALYRVRVSA
jgi:hypothetical protein